MLRECGAERRPENLQKSAKPQCFQPIHYTYMFTCITPSSSWSCNSELSVHCALYVCMMYDHVPAIHPISSSPLQLPGYRMSSVRQTVELVRCRVGAAESSIFCFIVTVTHSQSLTHCHSLTISHSLTVSQSLTHSQSVTHSHSLTVTHSLTAAVRSLSQRRSAANELR